MVLQDNFQNHHRNITIPSGLWQDLPKTVELEHRPYWAIKSCNLKLEEAGEHRKLQVRELKEIRNYAYKNSIIYKEKTKSFHDQMIPRK